MNKKTLLIVLFLGVIVGGATTILMRFNRPATPAAAQRPAKPVAPRATSSNSGSAGLAIANSLPPLDPVGAANQPKPPKAPKVVTDPDARAALGLVGSNAAAEKYWISAINNPALPAKEREDLIKDLDRDGLTNRKNPNAQDLALMVKRIQLIDQLAQNPMDQTNAAAFASARKDLVEVVSAATAPAP